MGQEIVKIFTAKDNIQTEMVLNTLKEHGIPAMKEDLGNGGFMNLYGGISRFGANIYVSQALAEEAVEILEGIGVEGTFFRKA